MFEYMYLCMREVVCMFAESVSVESKKCATKCLDTISRTYLHGSKELNIYERCIPRWEKIQCTSLFYFNQG